MTADDERHWWQTATDADIFGEPPYDVETVAWDIIWGSFLLKTGNRFLDLGCGPGRLSNTIAELLGDRVHVYGVDISRELIDRAVLAAPANAHYWRGDGRNIPSFPFQFTGAYSVTLFQHIPSEAMWSYIRQVHDLLVPGGSFVFTLAQGNISTFLNHQMRDLVAFGTELALIFDKVEVEHLPDEYGWHWVSARKEIR